MTFDQHKNFAVTTLTAAPSPATLGTTVVVAAPGVFPTAPFNATIWPANAQPTVANAEIVRVGAITGGTFTIARAQEGSTAGTFSVGAQLAATITKKALTDVETAIGGLTANPLTANLDAGGFDITNVADVTVTGLTGATAGSRFAGGTSSGAPTIGTFALGDFVIDQTGTIWICTVAGSPGTWSEVSGGNPAVSKTATVYVTTDGNDSHDGSSWTTAKLTIPAAISALPANGGIVEIGYGNWNISSPIVISTNVNVANIHLRGREFSWGSAGAWGNAVTKITNTGTGDAIQINGSGAPPNGGVNISLTNLTIVGNSGSNNGVTITNSDIIRFTRVGLESHGQWGMRIGGEVVLGLFDEVLTSACGQTGANGGLSSGGLLIDTATDVNLFTFTNCWWLANKNIGAYMLSGSNEMVFYNCDFELTTAGAVNTGEGIVLQGRGPYTFHGCWFEDNTTNHVQQYLVDSAVSFYGCNFYGNNVTGTAWWASDNLTAPLFDACYFQQHTLASLDNVNVMWRGCVTADSTWIRDLTIPVAQAGKQGFSAVGTKPAGLFYKGLPTSNPGVAGQVWSNSGVLTVSAG